MADVNTKFGVRDSEMLEVISYVKVLGLEFSGASERNYVDELRRACEKYRFVALLSACACMCRRFFVAYDVCSYGSSSNQ